MIRWLLAIACVLGAATARADNVALERARAAVAEVRYDEARELLVEALRTGGNSIAVMREIYELSAVTAVVLGQPDLAGQWYRRLLAIAPSATLPSGASPRLHEPFVAAQAFMAAHGRLNARATRGATAIEVVVTDPLNMVAKVSVRGARREDRPYTGQPVSFANERYDAIVLLDEHGNTLGEIAGPEPTVPPQRIESPLPEAPARRTPIVRRWLTWAIPAAIATGAGVGFLVDAQRAKSRLDDIIANDDIHFFADAEAERARWRRGVVVTQVSFVAGAALAVTAVVMAVTASPVVVSASSRDASVVFATKF